MVTRFCLIVVLLVVIGCGNSTAEQPSGTETGIASPSVTTGSGSTITKIAPTESPSIPTPTTVPDPTATVAIVPKPTVTKAPSPRPESTAPAKEEASTDSGCQPSEAKVRQPKSNLPLEEQIPKVSEIANAYFSGTNNTGLPRLKLPPDVRKSRRGGIVVNIEFNGDEYPTIVEKKVALDCRMRDGYEVFYASGYDISEVSMTAISMGRVALKRTIEAPIMVMKTRLKKDAAEGVDWAKKNKLDFNEIWEMVTMNPAWKKELRAVKEN